MQARGRLGEGSWVPTEVLAPELSDTLVVRVRQLGAERLTQSADHHQQRLRQALRIAVETAEQTVMMALRTVDADLEASRHVALHRFPVTASREPLGRCRSHLDKYRAHGRPYLGRAGIEEVASRHWLVLGVVPMPSEERNIVRIVR
jgi:hypothetical protein